MLQATRLSLDSFKEHYHRVNLPRRLALQRYLRNQQQSKKSDSLSSSQEVPYKYNRWWVSNDHEFVHQFSFVEDPSITRQKREAMPPITTDDVWKEPQNPFFLPFAPYVKIGEYKSDADAKFMKPINVPRWKDYMQRTKPVVPRTWY